MSADITSNGARENASGLSNRFYSNIISISFVASNLDSGNSARSARAADKAHRRWLDLLPQPRGEGGGIEAHRAADLE
jgi:hypothetical protein